MVIRQDCKQGIDCIGMRNQGGGIEINVRFRRSSLVIHLPWKTCSSTVALAGYDKLS